MERTDMYEYCRTRTSVLHVVPYVQVSTAQLGVGGLLGVKLLGYSRRFNIQNVTKRGGCSRW